MTVIKKHILICGERHVGKSTLIRRLLEDYEGRISGFLTRSEAPDENGYHDIYIFPYGGESLPKTEENKIGSCNTREREIN
ncbi:MAG: ATP-binding protein [Oscillospiraceae bacterium]|nr:ATP-binding protein [Oscillospiraceae bacterium]